ncbi:MAG: DUF6056 family protein [Fusobacteriaceae bacterium]
MKEIFENKFVIILIFTIFIGMLVLNFYVPLMQDDLYNDFIFNGDGRIKNISDFIYSNFQFYMGWTGRMFSVFFAQLFALMPKIFFNFANSLVIILMLIGMYLNIFEKNKKEKMTFIFVILFTLFWFGIPMFGESVMWMSGSIAYLWSNTYLLFFVYFFKLIFSNNSKDILKHKTFMIIFSFIGGCTHEILVPAIILASLIYIFFNKNCNRFGLIYIGTFIISFFVMTLAPGNYQRWLTYPPIELKDKITNYFKTLMQVMWISKFIFIPLILSLIILFFKNKKEFCGIIKNYWYEFLIAIIAGGAMLVPPIITKRTFFGSAIFLIIIAASLIFKIFEIFEKNKTSILSIAISCLLMISYFFLLKDYLILNKQIKNNDTICYLYQGMMPLNYKPYIKKFLVANPWKPRTTLIPVDNILPALIEKKNGTGDTICFFN